MDVSSWVDVATVVGGFATAVAAAFALVGVPLVIYQVRSSRYMQREATAKNLYRQYLEDSIERPELVIPNIEDLKSSGRYIQYELFVAHMLYSLEEILGSTKSEEWKDVARGQIRRHTEYFESVDFGKKRSYYEAQLIELIDEVIDSIKVQS